MKKRTNRSYRKQETLKKWFFARQAMYQYSTNFLKAKAQRGDLLGMLQAAKMKKGAVSDGK